MKILTYVKFDTRVKKKKERFWNSQHVKQSPQRSGKLGKGTRMCVVGTAGRGEWKRKGKFICLFNAEEIQRPNKPGVYKHWFRFQFSKTITHREMDHREEG